MRTNENGLEKVREKLAEFQQKELDSPIQSFIAKEIDFKIGEKAPDFRDKDINGNELELSSLKGKVILLDFWATWCGPCIKEMPLIKEINEKHKNDDNFILIGVSLDTDLERMTTFIRERKMDWVHIFDGKKHDGQLAKLFRVEGIPKYILIDKEGRIRYNSHYKHDREILIMRIEESLN